ILQRIRDALRDAATEEPAPFPRAYRQQGAGTQAKLVAHFVERVRDYKATVTETTEAELLHAIAALCAEYELHTLTVPPDLPTEWIPADITALRDDPSLTAAQLDASDGVLTTCALGIAQTGTIVLDGGAGQGRRALSLVPDVHLCVVRVEQIVGIVPEAIARLQPHAQRPLTFISGPSATSDIELSRVEGVHGPRTLHVLLVGDSLTP
ncbi:MAG TPA: lactate utilization protein C, partial [Ktedonobacterales bacterium]|nr:lactate utilization protein C [Ktedonobacterales bacterium]